MRVLGRSQLARAPVMAKEPAGTKAAEVIVMPGREAVARLSQDC